MTDPVPIRDAATIIVMRGDSVLMGQRGKTAAFMPNKFVFPGGATDPVDARIAGTPLPPDDHIRLGTDSDISPEHLAAAAIRELWEETGHILGHKAPWPDPPAGWRGFAATGHIPDFAALRFFFRAVTPQGRPRRFDARFFLADAARLVGDLDDFSRAEDELRHLQWVPLAKAREFDLPFITKVVLSELMAHLKDPSAPRDIPFFRNDDERHLVTRLGGAPIL